MSEKDNTNTGIIIVVGLAIILSLGYGAWHLKRWWNYTWGYQSQVTETVCEMVKPEYLINPEKCNGN